MAVTNLFLISIVGLTLTSVTAIACPISFCLASSHSKKEKNDRFCIRANPLNKSLYEGENFLFNFSDDLSKFKFSRRKGKSKGTGRKGDSRTNSVTSLRKTTEKNSYETLESPANAKFSSAPVIPQ